MTFLWTSLKKELIRIKRDPIALIVWILVPAIMTTLLSAIFGANNGVPQGRLLIVDEDKTFVGAILPGLLNRTLGKAVLIESVDWAEGKKQIDRGDASGLLVIPQGFWRAALGRGESRLTLYTNPSQRILPEMIKETLAGMVDANFYYQKLMGGEFDQYFDSRPSDLQILQSGMAMNKLGGQLEGFLSPQLITVENRTSVDPLVAKLVNFGTVFFPGMLMLSVLGFAQSSSIDLWRERAFGTLRRLATTQQSLETSIGAKLLSVFLIDLAIAICGSLAAIYFLGARIRNFGPSVLWVAAVGVVLYMMMLLLQTYSSNDRTGHMMTLFLMFVFSMAGGTFFPFEIMPDWLARVGRFTPNGWGTALYKEIIAGPVDPMRLWNSVAGLALAGLIAFLIVVRSVRRWV